MNTIYDFEDLSDEQKERVQKFDSEMSKLVEKYNIIINACSCCNGTWLEDTIDLKFRLEGYHNPGKYQD